VPTENVPGISPTPSVPSPSGQKSANAASASAPPGDQSAGGDASSANRSPYLDPVFEITLIYYYYEGKHVRHPVCESMPVSLLMTETARIFLLDLNTGVLMLFSATPAILNRRALTLQRPPWVGPNSTLFVFVVVSVAGDRFAHPPAVSGKRFLSEVVAVPRMHSKLLGTFKLPKFDGTLKNWKQWDRDFVRFLRLHQLEHVLLESFLLILPQPQIGGGIKQDRVFSDRRSGPSRNISIKICAPGSALEWSWGLSFAR
jgi:hypothetical protein